MREGIISYHEDWYFQECVSSGIPTEVRVFTHKYTIGVLSVVKYPLRTIPDCSGKYLVHIPVWFQYANQKSPTFGYALRNTTLDFYHTVGGVFIVAALCQVVLSVAEELEVDDQLTATDVVMLSDLTGGRRCAVEDVLLRVRGGSGVGKLVATCVGPRSTWLDPEAKEEEELDNGGRLRGFSSSRLHAFNDGNQILGRTRRKKKRIWRESNPLFFRP